MKKNKMILIAGLVFFFMMSAYFFVKMPKAQTSSFESADSEILAAKIDKISADFSQANQEISKKLDQVLANQATILQELQIVKIRASRSK